MKLDINEKFKLAIDLLENSRSNLFITGEAGTGKSTLLDYFRNNTNKNAVYLAPTGVAAVNINAQTIHSFFRFGTDITINKVKKIWQKDTKRAIEKLDILIIDEISMVRADLLDCIDKAMQINTGVKLPFGGKQVAFFGDLLQLPPVVKYSERDAFKEIYESCYFFSANVMKDIKMDIVELNVIYRQNDPVFIDILNGIRNNNISTELLDTLNGRVDPYFIPKVDDYFVLLTARNDNADMINQAFLDNINGRTYYFDANITGKINKNEIPGSMLLALKEGAQVMFLKNDPDERWVNGTMGLVTKIKESSIRVETINGCDYYIEPTEWTINRYIYNEETKSIETEKIGSFEQYPVKLAWAMTIHKSQGKTFPRLIVDSSGAFASGQVYVALSRCPSLNGLVLKNRIGRSHILTDKRVISFLSGKRVNQN